MLKTLAEKLEAVENKYDEIDTPFAILGEIPEKIKVRIIHVFQMTPEEWKNVLNYRVAAVREAIFGVFMKDE